MDTSRSLTQCSADHKLYTFKAARADYSRRAFLRRLLRLHNGVAVVAVSLLITLLDEYAWPCCLLLLHIGVVGWRMLLLCWLFPPVGTVFLWLPVSVTARLLLCLLPVAVASLPIAHPVSPPIARSVLRFSLDGFVPVSLPLEADAWRRPEIWLGKRPVHPIPITISLTVLEVAAFRFPLLLLVHHCHNCLDLVLQILVPFKSWFLCCVLLFRGCPVM